MLNGTDFKKLHYSQDYKFNRCLKTTCLEYYTTFSRELFSSLTGLLIHNLFRLPNLGIFPFLTQHLCFGVLIHHGLPFCFLKLFWIFTNWCLVYTIQVFQRGNSDILNVKINIFTFCNNVMCGNKYLYFWCDFIRFCARKMFHILMAYEDFDKILPKYLSRDVLNNIQEKLDHLKAKVCQFHYQVYYEV